MIWPREDGRGAARLDQPVEQAAELRRLQGMALRLH
jgi:hypothetical protein